MNYCFKYWKSILTHQQIIEIIEKDDYNKIINEVKQQLPILLKHIKTIIYDSSKNRLVKSVVDDEFQVSYEIMPEIIDTGKIELV